MVSLDLSGPWAGLWLYTFMCDFMVTGFYQQRQLAKAVLTQPWLLKSWDAMQNVILKKKNTISCKQSVLPITALWRVSEHSSNILYTIRCFAKNKRLCLSRVPVIPNCDTILLLNDLFPCGMFKTGVFWASYNSLLLPLSYVWSETCCWHQIQQKSMMS